VLGSKDRKVRDAKAVELLSKGFTALPPLPPPPPPVLVPVVTNFPTAAEPVPAEETSRKDWLKITGIVFAIGLVVLVTGSFFMKKRARNDF